MTDDGEEFPGPDAPMAVARKLFQGWTHDDGRTLVSWRGTWMRWRGTHWSELETADLRSRVYAILERKTYLACTDKKNDVWELVAWNPNRRKVADVVEASAAVGHLPETVDTPSWLVQDVQDNKHYQRAPAHEIISCTNGLLHVGSRKMWPHTPAFFNQVAVPFDYQPDTPDPSAWLDFLDSVWPDDPDSIALLQEYIGYVLSGRTDMQKMLLLIGPTRSGKGTIARMLAELVGRLNVAGPTLASLAMNFGLSPLLGKPLAIVSDARLGSANSHTIVERLLSITGEDMLTVDRKFKEPWSGKLPSRFVILSNELPRFGDASGAIANRFLILQMKNSFLGREDRTLDDRLRAELPGILAWALDGLDRVAMTGRFTIPQSSRDATTLLMDIASPISAFVRDWCVRTPAAHVDTSDLYEAWNAWCEENGHRPTSNSTFGRDLRAVVPELAVQRVGTENRSRRYVRLGLQPDTWPRSDLSRAGNGEMPGRLGRSDETAGQDVSDETAVLDGDVDADTGTSKTVVDAETEKPQVNELRPRRPGETALPALHENDDPPDSCGVCGQTFMIQEPGKTICAIRDDEHERARADAAGIPYVPRKRKATA